MVFARRSDKLAALVQEHPETMLAVAGDVTNEADIERAFAEAERRLGSVDILVNNAGIAEPSLLVDTPPEKWRRTIDVNLNAVYLATRRALPGMIAMKKGTIINIASISGVVGPEKFPGFVSYCASKGALISMTEALAVEVRQYDIRVNAISPGSVDTTMWAEVSGGAPAAMTADEIAKSVLFLASDESRPMNGQNLNVFSA